jgi:hypothetical protein
MGEIFEDQIFCANVHKGNVKRAPSSPILGHMQVLNVSRTMSFGLCASPCFTTSTNSGRILHILANAKRIQANVAVLDPLSLCASLSTWFRPLTWCCVGGQK